jgi:hypothetical protein
MDKAPRGKISDGEKYLTLLWMLDECDGSGWGKEYGEEDNKLALRRDGCEGADTPVTTRAVSKAAD